MWSGNPALMSAFGESLEAAMFCSLSQQKSKNIVANELQMCSVYCKFGYRRDFFREKRTIRFCGSSLNL